MLSVVRFGARRFGKASLPQPYGRGSDGLWAVLVAIGLAASSVASAQPSPKDQARLAPEIESLLDAARALPAEYTIDILRRVAASPDTDPRLRQGLVDEAFELAPRLVHPFAVASIHAHTDTPSGRLSIALRSSGLDRLTTQVRLISYTSRHDPALGRAMFERMPQPSLPAHTCQDTAIPDPSAYYRSALETYIRVFSAEEREEGADHAFLLAIVRRAQSTLELSPLAELILGSKSNAEELAELIPEYSLAIARTTNGDRELAVALQRQLLMAQWLKLVHVAQENEIDPLPLLTAIRGSLVSRLSGERCRDNVESGRFDKALSTLLTTLATFTAPDGRPLFEPLTEKERTPSEIVEPAAVGQYWETPETKSLLAAARHLRFGDQKGHLTSEQRLTPDWEIEARALLSRMADWEPEPGRESAREHFFVKAGLYEGVVELAPQQEVRREAIRGFLGFLHTSRMQTDDPLQYLAMLQALLNLARELTEDHQRLIEQRQQRGVPIPGLPNGSRDLILEEMLASRNPIIALYAAAEEKLPVRFGKWGWP